ncbi:hypothetical protein [Pseudomonas sp. NMS19W]|uniref:hypothetical protein n=1 Tax=Pseudomonas sp. NMS19W TaxID=3079768 RepID=UPI003F657D46
MSKERLEQLATEFRGILKGAIDNGLDTQCSLGKDFPRGSCDDASLLLAAFLTDNGHPGALRVQGESGGDNEELGSHVWLQLDSFMIDITGSQFREKGYAQPEVLVAETDNFLSTFTVEEVLDIADFREKFSRPIDHVRRTLGWFSSTYSDLMTFRELGRFD